MCCFFIYSILMLFKMLSINRDKSCNHLAMTCIVTLSYFIFPQSASFTVPWLGMSGVGSLYKTPQALLEQARNCCSPFHLHSPGHTQLYRSANSFHIFLRVLALCLAQDRAGGVPQRQIKGRYGWREGWEAFQFLLLHIHFHREN